MADCFDMVDMTPWWCGLAKLKAHLNWALLLLWPLGSTACWLFSQLGLGCKVVTSYHDFLVLYCCSFCGWSRGFEDGTGERQKISLVACDITNYLSKWNLTSHFWELVLTTCHKDVTKVVLCFVTFFCNLFCDINFFAVVWHHWYFYVVSWPH